MLVPRMGEYLVKKGLVTAEDLQKALDYQQEEIAKGNTILLGQALVELKLIKRSQLDQAVTEQIIQLRSALQAANRTLERRVEERTAELQKALERVSELSQLKANFISNISHELRTPLTHIKGYLELLITGSLGKITEEQKHALQVSQQSTNRLEGLIEDLIMVSLASRGELSIKQEEVDIRRLVNLSVKSYGGKATERDVNLYAVVDEDVPFVQADSQKIAWVLGQLVDNGIKFTPRTEAWWSASHAKGKTSSSSRSPIRASAFPPPNWRISSSRSINWTARPRAVTAGRGWGCRLYGRSSKRTARCSKSSPRRDAAPRSSFRFWQCPPHGNPHGHRDPRLPAGTAASHIARR